MKIVDFSFYLTEEEYEALLVEYENFRDIKFAMHRILSLAVDDLVLKIKDSDKFYQYKKEKK